MPRRGRKLKRLKKAKARGETPALQEGGSPRQPAKPVEGSEHAERLKKQSTATMYEINAIIHRLGKARKPSDRATLIHSLFVAVYSKGSYKQAKALPRELEKLNLTSASRLAASLTEARHLVEDIEKSNLAFGSQQLKKIEQLAERENEPRKKKLLGIILQRARRVYVEKNTHKPRLG